MRFLLLTGMSGAGKTSALRILEDLGALCVDNLPPAMIVRFIESCRDAALPNPLVALSVDVRSGAFFDAEAVVRFQLELRSLGYQIQVLFMDSSDDKLVARYKESRREHPLSGPEVSLTEAIARERSILQPIREVADYVLDTTELRTRELQKRVSRIVQAEQQERESGMNIEVMSFGFKRGLPRQADLVFDVRFLPNPFYIPELRIHSGMDPDVRDFVLGHEVTQGFLEHMRGLLGFLMPHYLEEGKHRLVIAIGCTGGAHRSVAIAEAISAMLREQGCRVDCNHRDVDLEQARWHSPADGDQPG